VKSKKFSIHVDQERCKGCGICVPFCARGLLKLSTRLNEKGHSFVDIQGEEKCGGCMNCAVMCPEAAVELTLADPDTTGSPANAGPAESTATEASWATNWAGDPPAKSPPRAKRGALAREEA
jgi:2-oxoglutarate ferredoxin oxidoreductase subunit delta